MDKTFLAVVVATGDELVSGLTVDTNSAWLSGRLAELGVATIKHVAVGDDASAVRAELADAAARLSSLKSAQAGWVILTGGLGPTPDDLTRQAVAGLLGEKLAVRPEALAMIEARFARMGRTMAPANRVQAEFPPSAEMIPNHWGTAPGLRFIVPKVTQPPPTVRFSPPLQGGGGEGQPVHTPPRAIPPSPDAPSPPAFGGTLSLSGRGQTVCFCLPGVPGEMREMFEASVAPEIRQAVGAGPALLTRTIHTFGIGESDLAERLGGLLARGTNPQIGTTAAGGSVSVRIYARGGTAEQARRLLDEADEAVVARLGDLCFGHDSQTLQGVVGQQLRAAGQTLALAESCTGGLLATLLTDIPGSSDYFIESAVCYANESKVSRLGVRPEDLAGFGAVSEPVASQMAAGERERSGADWAISITGIAGPGGGTVPFFSRAEKGDCPPSSSDKPVGLAFIGLAGPQGVQVRRHLFIGDRDMIRLRAARTAMNWLRLELAACCGPSPRPA